MVRNEDLPEMGSYAQAVARSIAAALARESVSGSAVARHLGRAQSYVSYRINGRLAWTTDEVDQVATLLGIPVDQLWASVRDYVQ